MVLDGIYIVLMVVLLFESGGIFFFFFNDTATTEIYTLSLHDALPIYLRQIQQVVDDLQQHPGRGADGVGEARLGRGRSEEHTSELQSQSNLVCRLLLEKKKTSA